MEEAVYDLVDTPVYEPSARDISELYDDRNQNIGFDVAASLTPDIEKFLRVRQVTSQRSA